MDNSNVLSKEETAALLQGIQDGSVETERGAGSAGQVMPYDFAERNSIVRGNLPGLERIHERFARELSLSLSTLLRREVDVAPLALNEHKLGDYLRTLSAPSSLNLFDARPLPGPALLALDPVLVYLAVDSYFGGPARAPTTIAPRPLTAGEQRVIELVRERAFAELRKAWAPVKPLELTLAGSDSDPQFLNFGADGDTLLVARFEVKLGQGTGALHVALPSAFVEPVREQLDSGAPGGAAAASQNEWSAALARQLANAPIELRSALVKIPLTLGELLALKPGDVIPTDLGETITVASGGTPLFRARFGASRGFNALRITERITSGKASRNPT
jgi:flagellar motor switch protein FliM